MIMKQPGHDRTPQHMANDSIAVAAQCARRLLELRAQTGETQKQLATRLSMTESMISRLERGDHMPSLRTLCRIADAFGRRLEIVFHEHEHEHADGTRHSHPHSHLDPDHQHDHGDEP
jgi:transcriptional regulator with XRE-family HTH domain